MKLFSFPKTKRLVTNSRFRAVLARRVCAADELLTVYVAENDCDYPRLGVSVGKACGNAVTRNRLKRLIREAFRQNQYQLTSCLDYLVMISPRWAKKTKDSKKNAQNLKLDQISASFLTLAAKAAGKIT